jgi:hypothetical protein
VLSGSPSDFILDGEWLEELKDESVVDYHTLYLLKQVFVNPKVFIK